jgi:hypothetical protein
MSFCLAETNELNPCRLVYEDLVTKAEAEAKAGVQTVVAGYGQSLMAIREQSKRAGDLQGLLAANKEIARFEAEKTVPEQAAADLSPAILNAHVAARKALAAQEVAKYQKLADLARRYVVSLTALQKSLVIRDKVEEALVVDKEMKRMQFVLADVESRLPVPPPAPEAGPSARLGETTPEAAPSGPPGNVVKNGGFESQLTGWEAYDWSGKSRDVKTTTRFARSGRYALVHEPKTSLQQRLVLTPGRAYRASYWIKVLEAPANGQVGGIYFDSTRTGELVVTKASDWQEHAIPFTATRTDHTLTVFCGREGGEMYIDDVVVVPLASSR